MQVVIASNASAIRLDFNSLFNCLLNSRADSIVKKYLKEINKFLLWCRTRKIALQLPFSSSVVELYLFGLDQQLRSPAAMVLVHAALKWFHSFVPDHGSNPLDNACWSWLIFSKNTSRFAMVLLKILCQGVKRMYIERATVFISLS